MAQHNHGILIASHKRFFFLNLFPFEEKKLFEAFNVISKGKIVE